ncbi:MAG: DNA replication/repair protein RecF [Deltaproteobacteria bacterium]
MKLKKIYICSFRNIEKAEIYPDDKFNLIVGNNAQGKTNFLESIYLLGTMKSFRLARNPELIKYGNPFAIVRGLVDNEEVLQEISLSIENAGKKVRINGKPVTQIADFFGCLSMVVFSPEDLAMVRGLPDLRRKYLDRAIFSSDISYLSLHQEFHRILKNRNNLLKREDRNGLDTWTERLAETGARLVVKRVSYIQKITKLLTDFYAIISGHHEQAEVIYRSEVMKKDGTAGSAEEVRLSMLELLHKNASDENRRGLTLTGPHRDDINFSINGKSLKFHGSQGEQRSFILALKMAEIEYIKKLNGNPPILLLDDMTSELDMDRNNNFMEFLKIKDMQVFITTTSLDNITLSGIQNYKVFPVRGGTILQ